MAISLLAICLCLDPFLSIYYHSLTTPSSFMSTWFMKNPKKGSKIQCAGLCQAKKEECNAFKFDENNCQIGKVDPQMTEGNIQVIIQNFWTMQKIIFLLPFVFKCTEKDQKWAKIVLFSIPCVALSNVCIFGNFFCCVLALFFHPPYFEKSALFFGQ